MRWCTRSQEAAWPGLLTWMGQRDIPYHREIPQCTNWKNWLEVTAHWWKTGWALISTQSCKAIILWIICFSSLLFLSLHIFCLERMMMMMMFGLFQLLNCPYFKPRDSPFLCHFPPCWVNGGGWVSFCIAQSCQLGLNHDPWLNHATHTCTRNWGELLMSLMKIHIV